MKNDGFLDKARQFRENTFFNAYHPSKHDLKLVEECTRFAGKENFNDISDYLICCKWSSTLRNYAIVVDEADYKSFVYIDLEFVRYLNLIYQSIFKSRLLLRTSLGEKVLPIFDPAIAVEVVASTAFYCCVRTGRFDLLPHFMVGRFRAPNLVREDCDFSSRAVKFLLAHELQHLRILRDGKPRSSFEDLVSGLNFENAVNIMSEYRLTTSAVMVGDIFVPSETVFDYSYVAKARRDFIVEADCDLGGILAVLDTQKKSSRTFWGAMTCVSAITFAEAFLEIGDIVFSGKNSQESNERVRDIIIRDQFTVAFANALYLVNSKKGSVSTDEFANQFHGMMTARRWNFISWYGHLVRAYSTVSRRPYPVGNVRKLMELCGYQPNRNSHAYSLIGMPLGRSESASEPIRSSNANIK